MVIILLGLLVQVQSVFACEMMGMSGMIYFVGALASALVFLGFGVALVRGRTERHARWLFLASLAYLPVVFTLMLVDRL